MKPKGVWGEHPRYTNQPVDTRPKPKGKTKPVKSRTRYGKPIKDDVSDGGGGGFIVFVLILIFLLIVLALW